MTQRWTEEMLDKLAEQVDRLAEVDEQRSKRIEELNIRMDQMNIRIDAYQKSSTQVVNLAFGLLATATITVILTSIMK